jgi:lipoprotein-releasing system permease protein
MSINLLFLFNSHSISLNNEYFIARRLLNDRDSSRRISRSIVKIAVFGISLGLAVMIITVAVVTAFKQEIRKKVIGFGGEIQLLNFDSNPSYETKPVDRNLPFLDQLKKMEGIKHVQVFATKPGIIKTADAIQGIVVKGIGPDYNWDFFRQNLKQGTIFSLSDSTTSNGILISVKNASLLHLKTGDDLIMYFVQDPPRMRKFKITGLYETGLEEFDKTFAIADIRHIQKLNNWGRDSVSGFEISVTDFDKLDELTYQVKLLSGYKMDEAGNMIKVMDIRTKFPQIFDWLNLFNMNVTFIIVIMLIVAGINMISGLLVLILERTNMIGILKALGSTNVNIRKIFLYLSGFLIVRGLLWGDIIGLTICLVQKYFHILKLDPSAYFLSTVPINFEIFYFLLLNIGTLASVLLILMIPSIIIARISPEKTIRYN